MYEPLDETQLRALVPVAIGGLAPVRRLVVASLTVRTRSTGRLAAACSALHHQQRCRRSGMSGT